MTNLENVNFFKVGCFLGDIIFGACGEVDLKRTDAVRTWLIPLTHIDIRSFFGLDGYYRRFDDGFSSISSPLIGLTQKR